MKTSHYSLGSLCLPPAPPFFFSPNSCSNTHLEALISALQFPVLSALAGVEVGWNFRFFMVNDVTHAFSLFLCYVGGCLSFLFLRCVKGIPEDEPWCCTFPPHLLDHRVVSEIFLLPSLRMSICRQTEMKWSVGFHCPPDERQLLSNLTIWWSSVFLSRYLMTGTWMW